MGLSDRLLKLLTICLCIILLIFNIWYLWFCFQNKPKSVLEPYMSMTNNGETIKQYKYVGPRLDEIISMLGEQSSISNEAKIATKLNAYRLFTYSMLLNGNITKDEDRSTYGQIATVDSETGKKEYSPAVLYVENSDGTSLSTEELFRVLKKSGIGWTHIIRSFGIPTEDNPEHAYVYLVDAYTKDTLDVLLELIEALNTPLSFKLMSQEELDNFINDKESYNKISNVLLTYPYDKDLLKNEPYTKRKEFLQKHSQGRNKKLNNPSLLIPNIMQNTNNIDEQEKSKAE